jgi:NADH-quinone oxidoreductase subunit J
MTELPFSGVDIVFYICALLTVLSAAYAVFSRNIIRSVFSLLGAFIGVAGLYALLSADFAAVIQLMIYVGGILVLLLFAVMLTANIEEASHSNKTAGRWLGYPLCAFTAIAMLHLLLRIPWVQHKPLVYAPTVESIGQHILGRMLLPFELLSILLLAVVVGAVVIVRRRNTESSGNEENSL